jgi:enterochelin esterase-like enzyme
LGNPIVLALQDGGWVQLPEDGTGKQIAHVLVDEVQSDGSTETVYLPRMVITGSDGELAAVYDGAVQTDSLELRTAVDELTHEVRRLRETLLLIHA